MSNDHPTADEPPAGSENWRPDSWANAATFQSLLSTSNAGIVITDGELRILHANDSFGKMVDRGAGALTGSSFRDFLPPTLIELLLKSTPDPAVNPEKPGDGTTHLRRQVPLRSPNAKEVPVDINFTVTFDTKGVPRQFTAMMFDVTEHQRHLAELRNATLASEAASNAKSQFLAHMSHEIRTPLNGVIGLSDLLMGTDLSNKQREYAGLINVSGKSLLFLINDILDFSKIEAGKLEIEKEEFDLIATVESVLGILATRASDKGLELCGSFSSDMPRFVRGDSGRLRQILINLVGNALKFTVKGGVKLQVVVERLDLAKLPCNDNSLDDQALIRFSVVDTGIGIPKQYLSKLFQSFSQIDNTATRKHDGSGLGLAISKRLVEMMQGELQVRSIEGEGSVFWFTLPFECRAEIRDCPAQFSEEAEGKPLPECPRLGGTECPLGHRSTITHGKVTLSDRSAIVVDDNEVQRSTLAEQLESWGMDVSKAASKDEAMAMLLEAAGAGKPYQLAIVDSSIADGEGMDLIEAMKADGRLQETAIILLTPLTVDTDIAVIHSAGVSMHVSKPVFSSSLFDATITALFSKEQANIAANASETEDTESPVSDGFDDRRSLVRILVAEDNRINQIVVRDTLENVGFQCRVVDNGRLAVDAAREESFDAILMDCQMPEMDGFEATASIRQNESTPTGVPNRHRIPIIALTANATRDDEAKCLNCGMDAYCSKPINPKSLVRTLDHWVRPVLLKRIRDRADEPISPFPIKTFFMLCGRNRLIATMVLSDFLNQIPRDLEDIEQSVCEGNADRAIAVLQHLRGKAGLLGADSLERRAADLENECATSGDDVGELLNRLFDEANRCLEYAVKAKQKLLNEA